jgi:hypothetical protein
LRIDVRQIFHGAHIAFAGVDADIRSGGIMVFE